VTATIRILPPEIASQIAAGEVVERPASAVKELLENALDAHARTIVVEVEQGGRRRIRISDDGDGIPAAETQLALERHGTSKLSTIEDLDSIRTLGFRGEALASISAVARVTLTSRFRTGTQGARIRVEGGKIVSPPAAAGCPQGTVVEVEDLFYNVPARLKFLKSEVTERRHIDSLVSRYALAYPLVRFRLLTDGRESLHTSGSGDRREVLSDVFGLEIAARMLELSVPVVEGRIRVEGFISPTDVSHANRKDILLFVNGRPIADAALATAVVQAYHTLLMVGRYPRAALFVDMPPEDVDVNVHPAKAEVRFRSPDAVFSAIQRTVRQTLMMQSPVPEVRPPDTWPQPSWSGGHAAVPMPEWMLDHQPVTAPDTPGAPQSPPQAFSGMDRMPLLRVLGQIGATYLVAEGPDGLYLIDQHAAHERVLFEAVMGARREETAAQTLLVPEVVDFPPAQAKILEGQMDSLRRIGFDVELFGGGSFQVRALPNTLGSLSPSEALRAVVQDIEEDETPLAAEAEARMIARICKRAAVKAGHVLGAEEQAALVRALEQCQSPRSCPHGRPTMVHLPVALLERQFGRK
jgi:DNA mismatch repair protein MutL